MNTLEGRVALITGAARGLGRAHAIALAAQGAAIVACDVPAPMTSLAYPLANQCDLDTTVRLVEDAGGHCVGVVLDVRNAKAVDEAVRATLDDLGTIDVVVANAGVVSTGRLWEVDDDSWDEMVATNLTGVFNCLRAVVPPMLTQRFGRIVVMSSMGGRMGIPGLSGYNATKWGIIGMAKSLALEVAADGITVNVVCPWTTATPMILNESMYRLFGAQVSEPLPESAVEFPEQLLDRFRRGNPIPEPWLAPEDVTRAVLYLVTDPGMVTGSVLEVGLGVSARLH